MVLEKSRTDYEEFLALGGWPAREFREFGVEDLFEHQNEYDLQTGLACRRLPEAHFWGIELNRWKVFLQWREREFDYQKEDGKISPSKTLPDPKDDDQYELLRHYCRYIEMCMAHQPDWYPQTLNEERIEALKVTKRQMEGILEERRRSGRATNSEEVNAASPHEKRESKKKAAIRKADVRPKRGQCSINNRATSKRMRATPTLRESANRRKVKEVEVLTKKQLGQEETTPQRRSKGKSKRGSQQQSLPVTIRKSARIAAKNVGV